MVRRHDARTLPAGCVRVLGADHPRPWARGTTRRRLSVGGDLGRAIPLYEQTLADRLRVRGAHHPHTKIVRGNLAAARQHPQ